MTWQLVGNLTLSQQWQFSPVVPEGRLFRVRSLNNSEFQILIKQAQIVLDQTEFWGSQRLNADSDFSLFLLNPPSFFNARRIAVKLASPTTKSQTIQLEVDPVPLYNPTTVTIPATTTGTIFDAEVAAVATATSLLVGNSFRKGFTIWNDSVSALFIDFQNDASLTSYALRIDPGGYYEDSFQYQGSVSGIWAAADANGVARIRQFIE